MVDLREKMIMPIDAGARRQVRLWQDRLRNFKKWRSIHNESQESSRSENGGKYISRFTHFLKPAPEWRVLDVGCGSGQFRDCFDTTCSYIGVDPIVIEGVTEVIQGVGEFLPFKESCFDCVISLGTLDHVIDIAKVFKETNRVLKTGGIFAVGVGVEEYKLAGMKQAIAAPSLAGWVIRVLRYWVSLIREVLSVGPTHTYSLTTAALIQLFQKYSFDIIGVATHEYSLFIKGTKMGQVRSF